MSIGLEAQHESVFNGAMASLSTTLKKMPLNRDVPIIPVSAENRVEIEQLLYSSKNLPMASIGLYKLFQKSYEEPVLLGLIVGCSYSHSLAENVRQEYPDAKWGASNRYLSLVYHHGNRHIIWHEALHLLGAEDCYKLPNPMSTCEISNCIMQYAPDETNVKSWPFLCKKNVVKIQSKVDLYWANQSPGS